MRQIQGVGSGADIAAVHGSIVSYFLIQCVGIFGDELLFMPFNGL